MMSTPSMTNLMKNELPTLTIMCGLPGSGKSIYANDLKFKSLHPEKTIIISSSDIRDNILGITSYDAKSNEMVFDMLHERVRCNLVELSNNVIVDATNLNIRDRLEYVNKYSGVVSHIDCHLCIADVSTCINNLQDMYTKNPYMKNPKDLIYRIRGMANHFILPIKEEGYADIHIHYNYAESILDKLKWNISSHKRLIQRWVDGMKHGDYSKVHLFIWNNYELMYNDSTDINNNYIVYSIISHVRSPKQYNMIDAYNMAVLYQWMNLNNRLHKKFQSKVISRIIDTYTHIV